MYSGGAAALPRLVAEQRIEPRQPARRHGRRAAFALGAGQQHALGAERRGEIVRRQADASLGLRQAERGAHRPVDPRTGLDRRRPGALVQAAQHQQVGALQAGLERSPDGEPRMAAEAGTDRSPARAWSASSAGHSPPAIAVLAGPGRAQARQRVGQRFAGLAGPQRRRPRRSLSAAAMVASSRACGAAPACHQRRKSRRRGVEPVDQRRRRRAGRRDRRTCAFSMRARIAAMPGVGLQPAQALAVEPARGVEQRRRGRRPACTADASAGRAGRPARSRSSTAATSARSKAAGGVSASGAPAESSMSMLQRLQLGGDAARQLAVGRDQGGGAALVLQRLAQRQGDDQRLLMRRRAVGARHMLERRCGRAATRPRWSRPAASAR